MVDLIETFKEDHKYILGALERIKSIGTDYASMASALREMREAFLSHIGLEDTEFYVKLRRKANLNQDLIRTLDFIIKDLENLKISSLIFFEKYSGEDVPLLEKEFASDFHHFYEKVLKRIDLEENQLFPLFGRYIKGISGRE